MRGASSSYSYTFTDMARRWMLWSHTILRITFNIYSFWNKNSPNNKQMLLAAGEIPIPVFAKFSPSFSRPFSRSKSLWKCTFVKFFVITVNIQLIFQTMYATPIHVLSISNDRRAKKVIWLTNGGSAESSISVLPIHISYNCTRMKEWLWSDNVLRQTSGIEKRGLGRGHYRTPPPSLTFPWPTQPKD